MDVAVLFDQKIWFMTAIHLLLIFGLGALQIWRFTDPSVNLAVSLTAWGVGIIAIVLFFRAALQLKQAAEPLRHQIRIAILRTGYNIYLRFLVFTAFTCTFFVGLLPNAASHQQERDNHYLVMGLLISAAMLNIILSLAVYQETRHIQETPTPYAAFSPAAGLPTPATAPIPAPATVSEMNEDANSPMSAAIPLLATRNE